MGSEGWRLLLLFIMFLTITIAYMLCLCILRDRDQRYVANASARTTTHQRFATHVNSLSARDRVARRFAFNNGQLILYLSRQH